MAFMRVMLALALALGGVLALSTDFHDVSVFRAPFVDDISDVVSCDASSGWKLASIVPTTDPNRGPLPIFRCDEKNVHYAVCRHTHRTDTNNVTWHLACTRFSPGAEVLEKSFVVTGAGDLIWLTRDGQLERFVMPLKTGAIPEITRSRLLAGTRPTAKSDAPLLASFDFADMAQVVPRVYRDPYYIIEYKSMPGAERAQHSYLVVNTRTLRVLFWDMESVSTRPAFVAADDRRVLVAREHDGMSFFTWLIRWDDPVYFDPDNGYGVGEYDWPMPYLLEALPERGGEKGEAFRPRVFRPERVGAGMPAAILSGDRLCQPVLRGGRAWFICVNATIDASTEEQYAEIVPARDMHPWTEALYYVKRFQKPAGVSVYTGSVPRVEGGRLVFGGLVGSRRWLGGVSLKKNEIFTFALSVSGSLMSPSPTDVLRQKGFEKDPEGRTPEAFPLHRKALAQRGFPTNATLRTRAPSDLRKLEKIRFEGDEPASKVVKAADAKCPSRSLFSFLWPFRRQAPPMEMEPMVASGKPSQKIYGPMQKPEMDKDKKMKNTVAKPAKGDLTGKRAQPIVTKRPTESRRRDRLSNPKMQPSQPQRKGIRRVMHWLIAPLERYVSYITQKDLTPVEYLSVFLSLTLGLGTTFLLGYMLYTIARRELRVYIRAKHEMEHESIPRTAERVCRGEVPSHCIPAPTS